VRPGTGPLDIGAVARTNEAFRREVLTGQHEQVVVMTIPPGGHVGEEVHAGTDQVLVFVDRRGVAHIDGRKSAIGPTDLVFVHAGARHNFVNVGDGALRLITIYSPPEYAPGTVYQTKAEAESAGH
jgi:mannose-6-phosphate isomerase-like protein (cupin superfamily)